MMEFREQKSFFMDITHTMFSLALCASIKKMAKSPWLAENLRRDIHC